MATDAPLTETFQALRIPRRFTRPGVHPYDEIAWGPREAVIVEPARDDRPEREVFRQDDCEFPLDWSETAVRIVASKYFRYGRDDPRRERSLRQVIDRVVDTIRHHGAAGGYFADDDEAETFAQELRHILVTQKAAFNSPVWFNCGVEVAAREADADRILDVDDPPVGEGEPPVNQASACFILSVNDTMPSIQRWIASESEIFRGGSGAGVNLSRLRGDGEPLSNGGQASGPVSFMRWADSGAGSIKSGGGTRRAAKMVILDADHPDILEFVRSKAHEEQKAYALGEMGYDLGLNGDAWRSIQFQNANNSVRLTDDFFRRVEQGESWQTRAVASGEVTNEVPASELLAEISRAAWVCGDPGVQYEDTIQRWHTCPNAGRISASNPCSEYLHIDDSACNLASINLMEFLGDDGAFAVDDFRHAVRVMLTAQEIIVTPASYPTKRIGDNARAYRQLGLGYTNLGSLLMCQGLAYDSDGGRAWAGAITALLQGEAYAQSARMAARVGAYDGYEADREAQDRVVRMHRDAALDLPAEAAGLSYGELRAAAATALDDAVALGQSEGRLGAPGYRNAQVSVIAPTGTISFMMDAQTTGIEPAIGLISYKTLVGGGYMKLVNTDVERALAALGYDGEARTAILAHVDATGAIEGAPGLDAEHLPVFDCAFGVPGGRTIAPEGHVRMMAAVQPFVSGAISKTVNLPNDATVEDVSDIYTLGWRLGLKAIAIYRDGSKRTQPLSTTAGESPKAAAAAGEAPLPVRRRLPDDRAAMTHKFSVGGQEGYITVGLYDDGSPGEVFVKMSKQGSTVSGLMDSVAIAWSMALQHGVPVESLISKYIDHRFEPSGFTGNPRIPMARSVVDYLARWMASRFLSEEDQRLAGVLPLTTPAPPAEGDEEDVPDDQLAFREVAAPAEGGEGDGARSRLVLQSTGQVCDSCGSSDLVRSGTCLTCRTCGATSGCG
ncbi:MAG TPA: vitamin B12-dependent ribonucleotide reductase [Miltoncostaeaceae bacterium]|nr:vitamin B12-dependent ribonucleotide reductase [Miltoncostaeaceae bacterium]